ncbi:MAG: hypothetical protein H6579_04910 [Chitinophagales bacterium]|nr:hypothetical protein [Chitinophagales bacterium]
MKKVMMLLIGILIIVLSLEIGLRFTKKLKTYSELNFGIYQSPYDASKYKELHVWSINDSIYSSQTEFTYSYLTNKYGLIKREEEYDSSTNEGVVFLGDSFVFGVGASQDSSLPVLLENKLGYPVINAGIPGSDPYFEKVLLDSVFEPLGYNKYLFMLNFSDIYDYVIRGGQERFAEEGKIHFRKAPFLEKYYEKSFIVRAICHGILKLDYSLLHKKELEELKWEAVAAYTELFTKLAKKHTILIVLQPYARQYSNNKTVLQEVLNYSYLDSLEVHLKKNQVPCFNLNKEIQKNIHANNYLKYSWALDGHYNARGYTLISEILANELTLNYSELFNLKED